MSTQEATTLSVETAAGDVTSDGSSLAGEGVLAEDTSPKSTVLGASINFVNCIIGAGCIGFGGAIAASGGLFSIVTMIFCAYVMKLSFDLLIELGLKTTAGINSSYEQLGEEAYGRHGKLAVLMSKGVFCFGGLIAIIIIVKDNFAPSMLHLLRVRSNNVNVEGTNWLTSVLLDDKLSTFVLSAVVMLPLSLLRDLTPLERFSAVKICTFIIIIFIVMYLYFTLVGKDPDVPAGGDFYERWLQVRGGFIQNIGTYIFTFVAQHTCHLVYRSLKPELRNQKDWGKVSLLALTLSLMLALPIGLFPYMTYWENTTSNLFLLYPPSPAVDFARILLCFVMLLTYPPPFFSCRELIIISLPKTQPKIVTLEDGVVDEESPLLLGGKGSRLAIQYESPWLVTGEDRQLKQPYHVLLTVAVWGVTVFLALFAPSLGDVLNLVGCATGTIIAFILPALFAFRIEGYMPTAVLLLVVGGIVGCIGTYFSIVELFEDLFS